MKTTIAQERKILDLAVRINGDKERQIECGKPAVFVNLYPHTATITVSVHEHGWDSNNYMKDYDKSFNLSLDDDCFDDPEECINYLESLLKEVK